MHIKSFELENFRAFKSREIFKFSPITVFCGTNNSGKSTILKGLLLLKRSNDENELRKLYLKPGALNLTDFEQTKNNQSNSKTISFSIKTGVFSAEDIENVNKSNTNISQKEIHFRSFPIEFDNTGILLSELLTGIKEYRKTVCAYDIQYLESRIQNLALYDQNSEEIFCVANINEKLIGKIKLPLEVVRLNYVKFILRQNSEVQNMTCISELQNLLYTRITNFTGLNIISAGEWIYDFGSNYTSAYNNYFKCIDNIDIEREVEIDIVPTDNDGSEPVNSERILYSNELTDKIIEDLINILENSGLMYDKKDLSKLSNFFDIDLIKSWKYEISALQKTLEDIDYLPVMRSTQETVYTYKSQGTVLNDTISQFTNKLNVQEDEEWINSKLQNFQIAEKVQIKEIKNIGHQINIINNGKTYLMSDLGFGLSQLLPILLKICLNKQKILIIEEPEANLHPKLQSQLADLFIDAFIKYQVQFIVETHSEYLIRKLQFNVAKKIITSDAIALYYIECEKDKIPKTYQIKLLDDGSLSRKFGSGFFDEATNLQYELLSLKNIQSN